MLLFQIIQLFSLKSNCVTDLVDQIKQELKDSMSSDEFQRRLDRQRSSVLSKVSEISDHNKSRQLFSHSPISKSSITILYCLQERLGCKYRISRFGSSKPTDRNRKIRNWQSNLNIKSVKRWFKVIPFQYIQVKGGVYGHYFRSIGGWLSLLTLLLYVTYQVNTRQLTFTSNYCKNCFINPGIQHVR